MVANPVVGVDVRVGHSEVTAERQGTERRVGCAYFAAIYAHRLQRDDISGGRADVDEVVLFVGIVGVEDVCIESELAVKPLCLRPAFIVHVSFGREFPLNDARKRALSFDCTLESMRTVVSTYVHQRQWLDDPRMVAERFTQAISPGAWEAVAAARFKSPLAPGQRDFGAEDVTPYAKIAVPAMLAAGCHDVLREPNYAAAVAAAIPRVVLHLFEHSGHLPNIEEADDFNRHVLEFLAVHYPP